MKYLLWRVKRGVTDNSFHVDSLLKIKKKPSDHKTLHGTPVFAEKGYFKEESLGIRD